MSGPCAHTVCDEEYYVTNIIIRVLEVSGVPGRLFLARPGVLWPLFCPVLGSVPSRCFARPSAPVRVLCAWSVCRPVRVRPPPMYILLSTIVLSSTVLVYGTIIIINYYGTS